MYRELLLEHAVDGTLVLALLDALTLVELFLASSNGNDQLGQAALIDEQTQRDNRETRLHGVLGNVADFLAVQQQFTVAVGGVVIVGAVAVLGNIHVLNPDLTVDDHAVGIRQATLTLADRLNLGPREHDTGGERLDNLVVERRLTVLDMPSVRYFLFNNKQVEDCRQQQGYAKQQC